MSHVQVTGAVAPYVIDMTDEPELRRDPVAGRWAVIAPGRAARPIELAGAGPRCGPAPACPFCEGAEHETPDEVYALRAPGSAPNGPGWRLRIVPNKFPALRQHAGPEAAYGRAEVLLECPDHVDDPARLSDEQMGDVFRAYRDRLTALGADPRLAHVAVFKNVGGDAGASIAHTHSQLIATPFVPDLIRAELDGAAAHFAATGRCAFCELVARERAGGTRVIAETATFVAVAAHAPRFAYEMWVLPKAHEARYEAVAGGAVLELAALVKRLVRALDVVRNAPAYNWFLHTSPLRAGDLPHYHWHLEIMPRTGRPAGFEWGFGAHIVTVPPERAAAELRAELPGA